MAGPAFKLTEINDLARWAFGPGARAEHHPELPSDLRCMIVIETRVNGRIISVAHHSAAKWADAFKLAGFVFPSPQIPTFIQIGKDVFRTLGDEKQLYTVAVSNSVAALLAKILNKRAKELVAVEE